MVFFTFVVVVFDGNRDRLVFLLVFLFMLSRWYVSAIFFSRVIHFSLNSVAFEAFPSAASIWRPATVNKLLFGFLPQLSPLHCVPVRVSIYLSFFTSSSSSPPKTLSPSPALHSSLHPAQPRGTFRVVLFCICCCCFVWTSPPTSSSSSSLEQHAFTLLLLFDL